jgi:hypothetical protein
MPNQKFACRISRLWRYLPQGRQMDEVEQFSRLVGDIYDAALDRARWPDVLRLT